MPAIPPILAEGKLVSDFKIKTELFNSHFAAQCTPVKNASALPKFKYRTDKRLNYFTINENDIFLIIKNLHADKAHRWDNISIRIIQLCGKEIILPLQLLFKSMLEEGIFADDWKKSNVVPVHKKESTNLIKNYRPISLLPISIKIFERLVFNSLYNCFMQTKFSQVSYLVTHALHNCCQLHIKSIKVLTVTQRLTRGEFLLIFRKPFIKSEMRV